MTVITVHHPDGAISEEQRRQLAATLTDAVLVVECGHVEPLARWGFQVHFAPLRPDQIAVGGQLLSDGPDDATAMASPTS